MAIKFHYSDDWTQLDNLSKQPGDLFILDYRPEDWDWVTADQITRLKSGYRKVLGCVYDNMPTSRANLSGVRAQKIIDKGCNGVVLELAYYPLPRMLEEVEKIYRLTDAQNKLLYFQNNCAYWDLPEILAKVDGYVVENIMDRTGHETSTMAQAKVNTRYARRAPVFVIETTDNPTYIKSQCKKWGYNVFVKESVKIEGPVEAAVEAS